MITARAAALRALHAVATGRNERVREALDASGLRGREQAFAYELAHGVLRRERLLDHVIGGLAHRGLPRDQTQLNALRLGVYQLLFAGGVPAHAAVGETVGLVRHNKGFVNAILRRVAERVESRDGGANGEEAADELRLGGDQVLKLPVPLPDDPLERLAIVHSLPSFLLRRWQLEHGDDALAGIAAAATAVPSVWLRPATDVDAETLRGELAAGGVESTLEDGLLRWTGGESPFGAAAFAAGRFVVQDPTAFQAADAVPCGPGDTVIDLCAAPGTKTTLLAARVKPGGRVLACDIDASRRGRILENVARLRLEDVVDIAQEIEDLPHADAVLVDVPCSNTGVLGRRVEVRRRLEEGTFAQLAGLQRDLLRQALSLTRPGGHAVYSTCSIDREENEGVVAALVAGVGGCEVREQVLTLPQAADAERGSRDGGFFAVLRRT